MLFFPHWLCTEHHYLCQASVSMAITDGKCCGIIHVQERRQSRRKKRGAGWRGGTTWELGGGGLRKGTWVEVQRVVGIERLVSLSEACCEEIIIKKYIRAQVFPAGRLQMWAPIGITRSSKTRRNWTKMGEKKGQSSSPEFCALLLGGLFQFLILWWGGEKGISWCFEM